MLEPQDALCDCIRAIPAFADFWADKENSYRREDGSFTVCGVYMTLAFFLTEHWRSLTEAEWRALGAVAGDHNQRDEDPPSTVGACLLEGLEGEEFTPLVVKYFDTELLLAYEFGRLTDDPRIPRRSRGKGDGWGAGKEGPFGA